MLGTALTLMGVSALSQYQMSRQNANVMEAQAQAERESQRINEEIERDRVEALMSEQRAQVLGAGLTMRGSPLMTALDTRRNYRRDERIRYYNANVRASQAEAQADLYRQRGIGTLLGTAGQMGMSYLNLKK